MALSSDLLVVADALARHGQHRPKQAALRRALSTAYYAVFHFLIEQATRQLVGGQVSDASLRAFLARGFPHSAMKNVCNEVSAGRWPKVVKKRIGQAAVPPPPSQILGKVAAAFVTLQELRHRADYDTLERFTRADVIIEVGRAGALFQNWDTVPDGIERTFFLVLLAADSSRRSDE